MHYFLLHDLKAVQTNMQCSLIQEFMLYIFELGHSTTKATKNICRAKCEGAVDHSTVTRWFKKFCLGCKNLNDQARSSRPKTMDSKVTLLRKIQWVALEEYQVSLASNNLLRVVTFTIFTKVSWAAGLCLMLTKYCKTFYSLKYIKRIISKTGISLFFFFLYSRKNTLLFYKKY